MGCKIKERREFLKMSQEELAEKSAVSRATISSLENNSERNTSTKILKRIASALDTTVGELFFADDV
ncbi:helix-turn-helix transcriptional regulator [Anaerotruncus sp. DFI.9.16]|jgi:transcriptional regulator with XRE-family HTH domain|uniref:helix-turn-helix transcriptional regulator n=1 Tax=Anaerotruncus sp. DFI.9.16 TaxID=2965275 RepID=UPI00210CF1B3|nr:helix-turn-helix transcriptional regulator [Anaerotruncus sp. DFI.9.16]MCQ4896021.1 helix-turn-helix transcriptional regulator [Anaerotruncus sp. DFI.9.16]